MGGEADGDLVVGNGDVRVMTCGLGGLHQFIHKINRGDEVFEVSNGGNFFLPSWVQLGSWLSFACTSCSLSRVAIGMKWVTTVLRTLAMASKDWELNLIQVQRWSFA